MMELGLPWQRYFLVMCLYLVLASAQQYFANETPNRHQWALSPSARFLSLFTVYQWNNGLCTATSGEYGMCLPESDCIVRRGILGGPCAQQYGVCCVFMASCGEVARENGTYFVNPNHPNPYEGTGSCQLTVLKANPNVCQIRIDLEHFSISGPELTNHVCNTDQFLVSSGSPSPTICGIAHGEHMYIDTGFGDTNPIILTMITSGPAFPRLWRIRVSQIECNSISRADSGCLQYHTGIYGRVKSFNFDHTVGAQLSNQDYTLCIRPERNFCSIQYTACPDLTSSNRSRSFTLSGNSQNVVNSMVGGGSQGMTNTCLNDWLLIGCARIADKLPIPNSCEDRICGGTFNIEISTTEKTISTNVRPFRLAYHTDAIEAPLDMFNKGFCLDYVQQPCTNG